MKVKSTKTREAQIGGRVNIATNGGEGENREIKLQKLVKLKSGGW